MKLSSPGKQVEVEPDSGIKRDRWLLTRIGEISPRPRYNEAVQALDWEEELAVRFSLIVFENLTMSFKKDSPTSLAFDGAKFVMTF